MGATYDLATPVGKTRFEIPDTNTNKAIFTDAEIQHALRENGDNPQLAAAHCLEVIAGDPQRLLQWSRGSVSAGRAASADLLRRAEVLRGKVEGISVGKIERSDFWW